MCKQCDLMRFSRRGLLTAGLDRGRRRASAAAGVGAVGRAATERHQPR